MAKASANPGRELTAGEQRLVEQAPSGQLVNLSDLSDDDRVVSAEILRRLCLGTEARVDPRGVRIWGARIFERLDMDFCTVPHPLIFHHTSFAAVPTFYGSRLPALAFTACTLPGLSVPWIRIELFLDLRESEVTGEVILLQARIGRLDCAGATLENESGSALLANFADIGSADFGDGFSATGEIHLAAAKIGRLEFFGATLANQGGRALFALDAEIEGDVFLRDLKAEGDLDLGAAKIGGDLFLDKASVSGEVRLLGAKIGGHLMCSGATLTSEGGSALDAGDVEIGGNVFLSDANAIGRVSLRGAKVGRDLMCSGATLAHEGGSALDAGAVEIGGSVFLSDANAIGEVGLPRAKIGGDFHSEGATLTNEDDVAALFADGATIGRQAFLTELNATGEVRLLGAKIGGQLICSGATLVNEHDTALNLYGAEVGLDVFLTEVNMTGRAFLVGAKIGGKLDCSSATLENEDGDALAARDAAIGNALVFRHVKSAGGVDLYRATMTTLDDDLGVGDEGLGSWGGVDPLVLEGLTYARFGDTAEWGPKLRSLWLRQTSAFQVGAWQQLITIYRAHGRDDEATRAAVAMHNDRLARAGLSWYRRAGRWILRLTVGHGYRPWLAGIWALAIIIGFALIVWLDSERFAPEKPEAIGSPQPVVYAADAFLPIVDFGEGARWMPTDWTRWAEWVVILLGWALSTIFVAGFTRIVRS